MARKIRLKPLSTQAALAYAADRRKNIEIFARTNAEYYIQQFDRIGASAKVNATFDPMAGQSGLGSVDCGSGHCLSWSLKCWRLCKL